MGKLAVALLLFLAVSGNSERMEQMKGFLSAFTGIEWQKEEEEIPDVLTVEEEISQKTYVETAETLKKFGIGGITDELLKNCEEWDSEPSEYDYLYNKASSLISWVGSGETDYDTWEWTPSENGVYTFDMEVFDLEMIYTNFLRGVSALDKEELDFQNIVEDLSGVNREYEIGRRKVSFDWNGETYTLTPKEQGDWFDLRAADQLGKIIREHGNGEKRLYFAFDDGQGLIVFYRDADWAREFQKETGLELSETPW